MLVYSVFQGSNLRLLERLVYTGQSNTVPALVNLEEQKQDITQPVRVTLTLRW